MIRTATHDDVPAIAALGRKFHGEAGWADIADYVKKDCEASLHGMIDNPDAILLVAEDEGEIAGMAGGVTFPLYFNASHRTGQELFFYIVPGLRNGMGRKLLATLETEARALGCQSWIMIALEKIRPEATGRLYRREGYRAAEHSWIRRL